MADRRAEDGDHLVRIGSIDQDTGRERAVLFHKDGTTTNVQVGDGSERGGQNCNFEPCNDFDGSSQVVQHVRTGTGHRGPATVACAEFRRVYDKMQWRTRGPAQSPDRSE